MTDLLLAAADPLTHVVQHRLVAPEMGGPWPFDRFTILSNHVIMQILAAALVVLLLPRFVRARAGDDAISRLVPKGIGNAIEGMCEALRTHVARPALGEHTDRFMPYIWSAFFFVLTCNVLGLIPLAAWAPTESHAIGGTATGNVMVTAALAITTLALIVYNGLKLHGMEYVKHFFMGPWYLAWFIALLEVVGLLAKTFALCIRLFANMVAGHILLAIILSFPAMAAGALGTAGGGIIAIPSIIGAVAINFLELFVAFLQAFIFTFLSAMFIGQAVNIHHGHDEEHGGEELAGSVDVPDELGSTEALSGGAAGQ